MSGEVITVLGTIKTLEANGAAISNLTVAAADDASYDRMGTDGNGFPDGRFVLTCSFTVAPAENGLLSLYARELLVDGAIDADAPEATRPGVVLGSFRVNDRTGLQVLAIEVQNLPLKASYYLHNNGTGQAVSAGWTLTVRPMSYKAAA